MEQEILSNFHEVGCAFAPATGFLGLIFPLLGYLIGSLPFGLILAKLSGYGDIRKIGSGNIGATNVLRNCGKKIALLTLLLDISKGAFLIILFKMYFYSYNEEIIGTCAGEHYFSVEVFFALFIGLFAILGHCFPIWLKFKGGKGVATTLGVLLAAVPLAGLAACVAWLIVALASRISSLSALTAVLIAPIVTFFVYGQAPSLIAFLITVLIFWRHKDNIKRLLKGEEPKVSFRKNESKSGGKNAKT